MKHARCSTPPALHDVGIVVSEEDSRSRRSRPRRSGRADHTRTRRHLGLRPERRPHTRQRYKLVEYAGVGRAKFSYREGPAARAQAGLPRVRRKRVVSTPRRPRRARPRPPLLVEVMRDGHTLRSTQPRGRPRARAHLDRCAPARLCSLDPAAPPYEVVTAPPSSTRATAFAPPPRVVGTPEPTQIPTATSAVPLMPGDASAADLDAIRLHGGPGGFAPVGSRGRSPARVGGGLQLSGASRARPSSQAGSRGPCCARRAGTTRLTGGHLEGCRGITWQRSREHDHRPALKTQGVSSKCLASSASP